MFHLCLLKLFLQVEEKPPATLDSYVSGSPSHDPGRGDEPSLSVCHKEAGSGLQHGGTEAPSANAEGSSSKDERPAKWPKENSKGDGRTRTSPAKTGTATWTLLLAFLQEWQQRLEKMEQQEAQEGAIKLGVALRNPQDQSLEWIYQRWNPDLKALEPVPGADPVNHKVMMGWLAEVTQGMAARQSLLRFHSTRFLAESYQGETVTFLLTLGFRDPFMARMYNLLGLMRGLGSTKVAAFRMRPAKAERQPLVQVLEERYPAPVRQR